MPHPQPFSITLDTHALDAMVSFYCDRLGFVLAGAINPGVIYERRRLIHEGMGVEIVLRDCLPRSPIGSAPGTIFEITLQVDDPERAADGLEFTRREPEDGPASLIEVRDPGNYKLILHRAQ